jgi:hypothetical protein
MPSTFSPNLRIELISNGEQAGNWGSTTNTNLGTLVEDAISGYETVSVTTANQAFTYADGAADQARNAMIELTTTTGAVFNVYAPPSPKTYVIYNASAHAATVYNSTVVGNTTAAGTGVVVPAGRRLFIMTDGTNFSLVTPPASSANTPNTLVERDGSGNFAAGTITATFNGTLNGTLNGTITSATTGTTQAASDNSTKLATTAFVQAIKASLHPVGSIYINATNNTNPATLLGFGTWAAFGAGRVPVGFNASDPLFDTAEETGGSKDAIVVSHAHTGTTGNQSNDHAHGGTTGLQSNDHVHGFSATTSGQSANHTHSGTTAGAGAHEHSVYHIEGGTATSSLGVHAFGGNRVDNSGTIAKTTGIGDHAHNFSTGGVSSDHSHSVSGTTGGISANHNHAFTTGGVNANHNHSFTTASAGSSGTNANLQPYITVYMWKRTA